MNITMVHPIHGAKVAISPDEVVQDEKNGWSRHEPPIASPPRKTQKTPKFLTLTEDTPEEV